MATKLFDELKWRGLFDQVAGEQLPEILEQEKLTFYIGIDPTAASLHVGQLAVFNLLRTICSYGHEAIIVLGAGTGMIGDPSGRSDERNLLDVEKLQINLKGIEAQLKNLLASLPNAKFTLVSNLDWLGSLKVIDFLRDIGKHFSVNQMLSKDSVSSRLTRDDEGISFTEFSYMLLQSYDYYELFKRYNCTLQIGGSDQWGNIVSGIDLIRRLTGKKAYGLTMPLLTKKDGKKFGKSEAGTVWLDSSNTSPFKFYQFFLRQADSETIKLLKSLTSLGKAEIEQAATELNSAPEKRYAQKLLAAHLTEMVHGKEQLKIAIKSSAALYSEDIASLPASQLLEIFEDVPSHRVDLAKFKSGYDPISLLVDIKAASSRSVARQLISGAGFYLNNKLYQKFDAIDANFLLDQNIAIVRSGKKNYYLVQAS